MQPVRSRNGAAGGRLDRADDGEYRRVKGERDRYKCERNELARAAARLAEIAGLVAQALPGDRRPAVVAVLGSNADLRVMNEADYGEYRLRVKLAAGLA